MAKEKPEETPAEEEVPEEEPEEEPTEEPSEEEPEETPAEEEVSEEEPSQQFVKKERFDGMMSAYQKTLAENRTLKSEAEKLKQPPQPQKSDEEVWVSYLYDKMEEKRRTKDAADEKAASEELQEVSKMYPDLKRDNILETAIKYQTNLSTAAQVLTDRASGELTSQKLTVEEERRKKQGGGIAGKPGAVPKKGLTPYDPKLSLAENIEKGRKELNI